MPSVLPRNRMGRIRSFQPELAHNKNYYHYWRPTIKEEVEWRRALRSTVYCLLGDNVHWMLVSTQTHVTVPRSSETPINLLLHLGQFIEKNIQMTSRICNCNQQQLPSACRRVQWHFHRIAYIFSYKKLMRPTTLEITHQLTISQSQHKNPLLHCIIIYRNVDFIHGNLHYTLHIQYYYDNTANHYSHYIFELVSKILVSDEYIPWRCAKICNI